jgi:hypothetical protein
MLSYIDRGNIGNAYTAGMGASWGITSNQYSWVITAYYLAYIAFHWFILLWKIVSLPVSLLRFQSHTRGQLTQGTDVGGSDGLWLGCRKYASGGYDQLRGSRRPSVLDRCL